MLTTEREFPAPVVYGATLSRKTLKRFFDWTMPAEGIPSYRVIDLYAEDIYCDGGLVCFLFAFEQGAEMTTLECLIQLEDLGFRAVTFEELLCFAANYPEEPLSYTIPALGSDGEFNGMPVVPALTWSKPQGRGLIPLPKATRWSSANHRILVTARL